MAKTNLLDSKASGLIEHDHNNDGVNRRGFLKCMAWAGTGAFCVIEGGVLKSHALGSHMGSGMKSYKKGGLSFVQISDSHMGFNKPANPDVIATLQAAVDKINALPEAPEFILHTGDISHLSKPSEFDNVDQILKATNKEIFFVPGEHDVLNDDGAMFRERYGKNSEGQGWYSFDKNGVHFIGLVNVMNLKAGGLGTLGTEQLEWLKNDVKHLKHSTPIVVFAHVPLCRYIRSGDGGRTTAPRHSHT
jgi:Icc protein